MTSVYLADPDATHAAGARLGALAQAGDVVAAQGSLGAGKTSFAQGFARGLGVPEDRYVNSPTFAIMNTHPGRLDLHHLDLYRVGDPDEALGLGLDEIIGGPGVAYVEWPARVPEVFPADHLRLMLKIEGAGRRLHLEARGPRSAEWLAAFVAQVPELE